MRLYGTLTELTSLTIRLASGKNLKIKTDTQTTSAAEVEVNIPDVGGALSPAFLMLDTVTAQPIRGKTINFTQNDVTDGSLGISKLTAPSGIGNEVIKINPSTGVIESGLIKNANIAADAAIVDTKLATISTAGKVETGAVAAVAGLPGRVLTFSDAGVSSVAKIVNANVDDNAGINGSKLADGTVGAAKLSNLSSADLAGKITDETGSGSLVFASSPTLTTPSIAQINTPAQNLAISGTGALRLPFGTEAERPAGTAANLKGMIRYNDEGDAFEGYNELSGWSSLGGGGTTDRVTQASHGFVVGEVLYLNGSTYTKAIATAANTAEVVGVVSRVIDASTFELTLSGEISGLSGLTPGEVYFLSAATAGALTVTEPSVVGQVSLPVGVASSTTSLYVAPKRGVVVGGANLRTQIGLNGAALVSQTTNIQNVTAYTAGELSGWVYIDATTDRRFYIQVQFVKDAANAWKCAYQTTGDTPPAGFNVDVVVVGADAFVQVQMPAVAGWVSGSVNFALNAPAVGATLPLQVDSANVSFTNIQAASAAGITFKEDGGTTTMTITDAGNVGIGTTSPGARLDIQSANQALNPVQVRFNTSNDVLGFGIANSNGFPYIGYNTKSAVGTDIPTYERSNFATQLRMDNGEFKFSTAASGTAGNAITFAERLRINSAGEKVFGNGVIVLLSSAIGPGAGTYPVKWNASSGVLTYDMSSRLVKDQIEEIPYGLTSILSLQPRKYFRTDDQKEEIGFVADEVQSIIPEVVPMVQKSVFTKDEQDTELIPGGINYDKLTAVLVKAIQEQQAQIEALKAEVAALKAL